MDRLPVIIGWVLGVTAGLIAIVFVVAWVGISSFLGSVSDLDEAREFEASQPTCHVTSESEILVLLEVAPVDPGRVMAVHVDELQITNGQLRGVATLPADAAFSRLTADQRVDLELDLGDDELGVDVTDTPGQVVVRLHRSPDVALEVTSLRLWLAYGEPAAVQTIPLSVVWEDACDVSIQ